MTLSSMTGFASYTAEKNGLTWQWELKSVNGKGLEIRTRLPVGFDQLEANVRAMLVQSLRRGSVQVSLNVTAGIIGPTPIVNETALEQLIAIAEKLKDRLSAAPLQVEALLALPGIVKMVETASEGSDYTKVGPDIMESFEVALRDLLTSRYEEGARLTQVIDEQINRIEELACAVRDNPARSVLAIRARLNDQVSRLLDMGEKFDIDRLHHEAILIATRADVQEEVDRLLGHVAAARQYLHSEEPAGRKFEFLAQEFNREANTLCSKAIDMSMTKIGLELKTVIDQMREQVQNIE